MPRNTSTERASSAVRYTLPRSARVIRRKEFRRIYSRGSRAGGKDLIVVALRRSETGHRVGLSVSKANGCAVIRNKIKRIFREAFRLERPTLPGQYDVVMIPREHPEKYALRRVRKELRDLLGKIYAGKGRRRGSTRRDKR
jgi:ribonuclease P protein component